MPGGVLRPAAAAAAAAVAGFIHHHDCLCAAALIGRAFTLAIPHSVYRMRDISTETSATGPSNNLA